jgi:hypothetical protein
MFQRLEQSLLRLRSGQPWRTTKLLSHGSIFPHPSSTHGERPMPPSSLSRAPIKFQQRAPPPIYAAPTSRAIGSLFCGAPWTARRRRPPCARCFAQPPIAPSKTVVRNTPLPLLLSYFCARKKMLNYCVCLIAASGRRRASRLARSTKCQAMWTAHAFSHDSFRLNPCD